MLIWVNVGTIERKMPTYLYISQSIPAFEYIPVSILISILFLFIITVTINLYETHIFKKIKPL